MFPTKENCDLSKMSVNQEHKIFHNKLFEGGISWFQIGGGFPLYFLTA